MSQLIFNIFFDKVLRLLRQVNERATRRGVKLGMRMEKLRKFSK